MTEQEILALAARRAAQRLAADAEARAEIVQVGDAADEGPDDLAPRLMLVEAVVTQILLEGLPPRLKAAIDDALAGGHTAAAVWGRVRDSAPRCSMLPAAAEAYLESLGHNLQE